MLPSVAELFVGASVSFIGDLSPNPGRPAAHYPLCKNRKPLPRKYRVLVRRHKGHGIPDWKRL